MNHDHSSSNSSMSGMDMGGMGGSGSGPACKISMLWNWTTVDACFLSSSWHVKSKGAFAGSVIGVFLLVIAIEALRRGMREYDRYLTKLALARVSSTGNVGMMGSGGKEKGTDAESSIPSLNVPGCGPVSYTPSWGQQVLRSLAYGTQFTASYLVMLLGMYYNGYILFAIFIGHTIGYGIFGRDTCGGVTPEGTGSGHCC